MKNRILFSGLKAVSLGLLAFMAASCNDDIDNYYSRNQSEITIEGSGEYIKLDESKPDEVALTIDWSPAHDYGYDYVTTYQYEMRVSGSGGSIEEYEDDDNFHREFTNAELQDLLVNHFGVTTSTAVDVTFTITASFEGPTLKVPDVEEKTIKVKTYGPRQFVADTLYMAGTAVGDGQVEIAQTLENENLYAWRGELQAGTLYLPLTYEGTQEMSIVPVSAGDTDIHDGAQQSFTQVATATAAGGRCWEIPEAGTYRIVVNKEDKTITIYSAATDLKNKTIIFKRTQGEANDNYTCEIEQLWIFGSNHYYNGSRPSDVVLTQSLANPRLFVYKGEALQADQIKFCATDNWNNEYAFGSGDVRDMKADVTFGQKYQPIYGGQGNNRYAWFNMPEGTNYIEVYIGSEQYDEHENALSKSWAFEDSYVIFDQK